MSLAATIGLPALVTLTVFLIAVVLLPRRSPAGRVMDDLARRAPGSGAQRWMERMVDARDLGRLRRIFVKAGWYETSPAAFFLRCGVFAALGAALAFAADWRFGLHGPFAMGTIVLLAVAGGHLPFSRLNAAVKKRQIALSRAIPDLLDTLVSTVRAGLALNAALGHAAGAVEGPLADELRATLGEIRIGRARADALNALADRVQHEEIRTVVRAIVQAERLGANLSNVLGGLSVESRERRALKAEEIAAALPVKMVLPMALFMLPALFVMIFGAVAADYYSR